MPKRSTSAAATAYTVAGAETVGTTWTTGFLSLRSSTPGARRTARPIRPDPRIHDVAGVRPSEDPLDVEQRLLEPQLLPRREVGILDLRANPGGLGLQLRLLAVRHARLVPIRDRRRVLP